MATTRSPGQPDAGTAAAIEEFIRDGIDIGKHPPDSFLSKAVWKGLTGTGTEVWLDTGDIEGARALWCSEMSALTTNNTLLNQEVQKGIYDELTREAVRILGEDVDPDLAVIELAFILNARHGLRLVEEFGARVSVELHTDLAHDVERTLLYARRFHRICRDFFIVKIPFTPAGLIATRQLRSEGVPINMTLGFSARQNHVAARFAAPGYLNVFLGRLNAYAIDNGLGSGDLVGEKATLASQRTLLEINASLPDATPVRQIAASMRSADQVRTLAGVDVHTIPLKVAAGVVEDPPASWERGVDRDPEAGIDPGLATDVRAGILFEVGDDVRRLASSLASDPPRTPKDLVRRALVARLPDLFPAYRGKDLETIASDGKIPVHEKWQGRVAKRELAIDSLLNAAGLASFAGDQRALDDRIRGLMGR